MGEQTASAMADAAVEAWSRAAQVLQWEHPWEAAYEPSATPGPGRWFAGGRLNVAVNCLDRHLASRADQVAVHWEGEPGDRQTLTYGDLHRQVVQAAQALSALGVQPGDRVALYLSWLPETVVAMLACARIGAVHAVLAASLPADALADRLTAVAPKVLITQDGAWRHGVVLPLKARADEAQAAVSGIDHTVVVRRSGVDIAWYEGDKWWHDLVGAAPTAAGAPDEFDASQPLLVAPVASRRGRLMTGVYGAGGMLVHAATVHTDGLALDPTEVFWCAGDIAWVPSQVHGVYGPLACGAVTVMYEGMLDVPSHDRAWQIIERYGVETLLTTHTVARRLHEWTQESRVRPVSKLRRIVIAGEPIDAGVQAWLSTVVGNDAVLDGWGQFELGGIVTLDPPQPRMPDPGLAILLPDGTPAPAGTIGELVVTHPWAGVIVGFDAMDEDEVGFRWSRYVDAYATRDAARRRPDSSIEILGRTDDVVNISGQLVSLSAVADVLRDHPFVRDVDVVDCVDVHAGRFLAAAVVATPGQEQTAELARELRLSVRDTLGGLAEPRLVVYLQTFPPDLPASSRRSALRALCEVPAGGHRHVTAEQLRAAVRA